jgi:3-oxoacyl-(acyl-carrier-protein) synthase
MPCQIAGEIPDFNPELYIEKKEARRLPRSAQIALASAIQAVRDAGLPETMPDGERCSVVYGTALGGIDQLEEGIRVLYPWTEPCQSIFTAFRHTQSIHLPHRPPVPVSWSK